ncbi:hypothetical protein KJ693_06860 [bacterium]|nr:hypothetical protein [bacterium]MBU1615022.1 hypothetical protein [bacterium]
MRQAVKVDYDTYKSMERRLKILIGARWKDRGRAISAAKKQDELRKQFGFPVKGWNSTEELRKWRDSR